MWQMWVCVLMASLKVVSGGGCGASDIARGVGGGVTKSNCGVSNDTCGGVKSPCGGNGSVVALRVGALVDLNSSIGAAVRKAIELGVEEVNRRMDGFSLSLRLFDTKNDAFQAASAAMELLKNEVVAIVGPQSTTGSHFIAHMSTNLQVALVSYGATDPALSEHQYPFFMRLSHSDVHQMRAVANLISYYGWRTVVALYTDDDYGANAITSLEDALMQQHASMFRKEPLAPTIDRNAIGSILSRLAMMESRIFVVHAHPDIGLQVIAEAQYLGMIDVGFVWIITDLLTSTITSMQQHDLKVARSTQGFIGVQRYIPQTPHLSKLLQSWMQDPTPLSANKNLDLNVYAMCAYDSVWLIAQAIQNHLKQGSTFTFENQASFSQTEGGSSELARLRTIKEGLIFREQLLRTHFNGTVGWVELDQNGDMQVVSFEIVNVVGRGTRTIGYWANIDDSISNLPPNLHEATSVSTTSAIHGEIRSRRISPVKLPDVVWPGGTVQVPRGWVIPQNGRPLVIGVPRKAGYKELIRETTDANNVTTFHGFCINVFEAAVQYLPYAVTFQFVSYGSGNATPDYDNLIRKLALQEFDAVVGDATITEKRLDMVDFTQPYIESGMEIIVPWRSKRKNNEWAFLQPFTPTLWVTTGVFFLFTGSVIWMLEHKLNYAFRGRPKKQLVTSLWFIFSTLFFAQREKTKTVLGRAVLIIWLFVVLIITSSYTASLTSILTVQQLTPSVLGIHSLLASDAPIGYQAGSYVRDYLVGLGVKPSRLMPLNSKTMYAKALRLGPDNGGVSAIVDEHPYVQLFLSSEGDTEFTTAGQQFTKSGWAFAFQKNSQLTTDVSEAILRMSENGELQKIHNLWFNLKEEVLQSTEVESSQLDLRTFSGLFTVSGLASAFCVVIYMMRLLRSFLRSRYAPSSIISASSSFSRSAQVLRSFALFLDEPADRNSTRSSKEREEMAVSHTLEITPVSSLERDT